MCGDLAKTAMVVQRIAQCKPTRVAADDLNGGSNMSQITLKDLSNEAYLEAILTATQKGLTGEKAKNAAFSATARYVSKETGKSITTDLVAKAIILN